MAFNPAPSAWFAGYSSSSANDTITFQTNEGVTPSFPELTNLEADPTNGDYRKVLFAIMEEIYRKWSLTAAADRPQRINITRQSQVNPDNSISHNYSVSVQISASNFEVTDEPSP